VKLNRELSELVPYKGGPGFSEIAEQYGLEQITKLSSNEIWEEPFPEVATAVANAIGNLNRYPDGDCTELRSALSSKLGVGRRNLVFGNGSCEVLMLLGEALLSPGKSVVFPDPSFVVYRMIGMARGAELRPVPLAGHTNDLAGMAKAIDETTSLVVLCNPNNPTGTYVDSNVIREFLDEVPEDIVVALDEAYIEFVVPSPVDDPATWVVEHPNLVVLRTFSKIYGLAGLRVGYGVASSTLVEALDKIRQPFNVNSLSQVAALAALGEEGRVAERRRQVEQERARLSESLTRMELEFVDSQANFLLVRVGGLSIPAKEVPQALIEQGLLTRSGFAFGYPGWVRVTIGSRRENDRFLEALRKLKTTVR